MRYPRSDRSIIIFVNNSPEFFKGVFSKMEVIMALDYMSNFIKRYNINVLNTIRDINYSVKNEDLMNFKKEIDERRLMGKVPESTMDERFIKDFNERSLHGDKYKVFKEDIFYKTGIEDYIKRMNKSDILLCGFFTDTDIFISAVSGYIREFNVYIISDATSTYSERLYFQALEMVSQFCRVIDTRDMEKYF